MIPEVESGEELVDEVLVGRCDGKVIHVNAGNDLAARVDLVEERRVERGALVAMGDEVGRRVVVE